jgi:hypothetical protein
MDGIGFFRSSASLRFAHHVEQSRYRCFRKRRWARRRIRSALGGLANLPLYWSIRLQLLEACCLAHHPFRAARAGKNGILVSHLLIDCIVSNHEERVKPLAPLAPRRRSTSVMAPTSQAPRNSPPDRPSNEHQHTALPQSELDRLRKILSSVVHFLRVCILHQKNISLMTNDLQQCTRKSFTLIGWDFQHFNVIVRPKLLWVNILSPTLFCEIARAYMKGCRKISQLKCSHRARAML